MVVPSIIEDTEFEAVQMLLKAHTLHRARRTSSADRPSSTASASAPRGRYKYYTCSTKARQGETGDWSLPWSSLRLDDDAVHERTEIGDQVSAVVLQVR